MEEMNSIVTSFNKEKQEIIYHTNNENNYKVIQEICRLYIDRSSMTKEIKRLNNIINKKEKFLGDNIKRLEREVVKRDNIITELEKWLWEQRYEHQGEYMFTGKRKVEDVFTMFLDKLKELKENK